MSDTSLVFNLVARDRASAVMERMGDRFNKASATIGAGIGTALGVGVAASLDMEAANDKLAAQLGLNEAESARVGKVSGDLYANAYGDSLETVNGAVGAVMSSIKGMTDASSADLSAASASALNFAKAFDIDVAQGVQYVGTLINSGLAKDATEGFDLITKASQKVPAQLREDVLESANEYGQFFNTLGYNGEEAFALLVDASAKGQFGLDKAGDAIKEFTIRSTDMSAKSTAAYKTIGLDAGDMANAILAGGDSAHGATQKIIDGLLGIKDPASQANAAIALFGTPLEDLNVSDIPAFLDSLKGASGSMDDFAGASKRSGDALNDNASTALQKFKNKAVLALGEAGGAFAKFAMDNQGVVGPLVGVLAGLAGVVMAVSVAQKVYATYTAISTAATNILTSSTYRAIAGWTRMMAVGLMTYVRIAAGAVASAATTAAAWVGSALVSIGTWIAAVIRAGITAAAQFLLMAARAVAWAAIMAAQWLIAMGPIGWVIAAIVALVVLIILNWDKIKVWTAKAWDWIWGKIKQVGQFILNYIVGWKLVSFFLNHWQQIKTGLANKIVGIISYVRALPGRIKGALGNLGSLLYNSGMNVVRGLWHGIQAMGGWLRGQLMSFAKNMIPGPIAKALGIASPSKVMATVVGRWIPAGIVDGIESGKGNLDRTMSTLVQPPSSSQAMGVGRQMSGSAASLLSAGGQTVRVIVDVQGGDGELKKMLRKMVRIDGRGSVQAAFGTGGA